MEVTTKPFFLFYVFFFSFFLHTWLYLLMTPALIMLVVPGLPSYNGAEVYYLKGVIGLPIVISFRDRWYTHFFFWKWAHWWRHRHRLDRFRFQNFQSPASEKMYFLICKSSIDSICQDINAAWSVFIVCSAENHRSKGKDVQADLSIHWLQTPEGNHTMIP